jgi:hypothetical protein
MRVNSIGWNKTSQHNSLPSIFSSSYFPRLRILLTPFIQRILSNKMALYATDILRGISQTWGWFPKTSKNQLFYTDGIFSVFHWHTKHKNRIGILKFRKGEITYLSQSLLNYRQFAMFSFLYLEQICIFFH